MKLTLKTLFKIKINYIYLFSLLNGKKLKKIVILPLRMETYRIFFFLNELYLKSILYFNKLKKF